MNYKNNNHKQNIKIQKERKFYFDFRESQTSQKKKKNGNNTK